MYYFFNPSDSRHGCAGVLDVEDLMMPSGLSRAGASAALSATAQSWVERLSQPGMWSEPSMQHPLMCVLGKALMHTAGFPPDHGLLIGDAGGDSPLLHERRHAPCFAVTAGFDGAQYQPGPEIHCFLMQASGAIPNGAHPCGTGGDSFFAGLAHVMHLTGHLQTLLSQHRLQAGRSEDMLRDLLVRQLALRSPEQCESLAARTVLTWTEPPWRASPPRGAVASWPPADVHARPSTPSTPATPSTPSSLGSLRHPVSPATPSSSVSPAGLLDPASSGGPEATSVPVDSRPLTPASRRPSPPASLPRQGPELAPELAISLEPELYLLSCGSDMISPSTSRTPSPPLIPSGWLANPDEGGMLERASDPWPSGQPQRPAILLTPPPGMRRPEAGWPPAGCVTVAMRMNQWIDQIFAQQDLTPGHLSLSPGHTQGDVERTDDQGH